MCHEALRVARLRSRSCAGVAGACISLAVSAQLGDGGFWHQLAHVVRLLVEPDEEGRLLAEYLRLWPVLAVFAAKKLAVTVLAVLPIALAYAALALLASHFDSWDSVRWELEFVISVCLSAVLGLLVLKIQFARRRTQ